MKQLIILSLCTLLYTANCEPIIKNIAVDLNFNTMQLVGNNIATQHMFLEFSSAGSQIHPGGGLSYIQPGIDLATTLYFDKLNRHRAIVGIEGIFMAAKEQLPRSNSMYQYAKHNVSLLDIYLGYHYAFWQFGSEKVKLYAGPELMFNMMLKNRYEKGEVYFNDHRLDSSKISTKSSVFRLGGRIKLGVEGRIYKHIYVNPSCTIGIYNLLLRDDANGELFNIPSTLDKKESFQPFFNLNIGLQYKF